MPEGNNNGYGAYEHKFSTVTSHASNEQAEKSPQHEVSQAEIDRINKIITYKLPGYEEIIIKEQAIGLLSGVPSTGNAVMDSSGLLHMVSRDGHAKYLSALLGPNPQRHEMHRWDSYNEFHQQGGIVISENVIQFFAEKIDRKALKTAIEFATITNKERAKPYTDVTLSFGFTKGSDNFETTTHFTIEDLMANNFDAFSIKPTQNVQRKNFGLPLENPMPLNDMIQDTNPDIHQ